MEFDADRQGSGTKEWSEHSFNIQRGCQNGCLYCYACANAIRYKAIPNKDAWQNESLTKNASITSFPKKSGVIMMPTTHDITLYNLYEFTRVARLILAKGNSLLIVTKPRWECIPLLLNDLMPWRDQILLRFTIGSMSKETCAFWEPGAPTPDERIRCLAHAHSRGYKTSVSIEPMLSGIQGACCVVGAVNPYVTDTVWIGKMNKARLRVPAGNECHVKAIEAMQTDSEILMLYSALNSNPLIRWKDSIKEVVARCGEAAI